MKPGETASPRASITERPREAGMLPTALIASPRIPMSAALGAPPNPS